MNDHAADGWPFLDPELQAAVDRAVKERMRRLRRDANRLGPERFLQLCADRGLVAEAEAAAGHRRPAHHGPRKRLPARR